MKIVAHCLVKNEENFVWYAINSVMSYVDEIMVWDMSSVDDTARIVTSIDSTKIKFRKITETNVSLVRQQMLDETKADWIFILDGDEIWHNDQIRLQVEEIKNKADNYDVIVNSNLMLVGDMYHAMDPKLGKYKIHDRVGHYNIRFIKNTPGLHVEGVYPNEAYVNKDNVSVQNLPKEKILFSDNFYIHASFLPRSTKDKKKVKYERGLRLPLDYFYPEVFFSPKPEIVNLPWKSASREYNLRSLIEMPFKAIKRKII